MLSAEAGLGKRYHEDDRLHTETRWTTWFP